MNAKRVILLSLFAFVLIIIWLIVVRQYYLTPDSCRKTFEFAAATLGGIAALFSLVFALFRSEIAIERSRRERSFQLIDQLNDPNYALQRIKFANKIEDAKDVLALIMSDAEIEGNTNIILSIFEDVALAIRENIADEKMLYDSIYATVRYYYKHLEPYISHMRKHLNEPKIFINVEELEKSWSKKKSLRTKREL